MAKIYVESSDDTKKKKNRVIKYIALVLYTSYFTFVFLCVTIKEEDGLIGGVWTSLRQKGHDVPVLPPI